MFATILASVSSIVGGIFGFKAKQSEAIQAALKVVGDVNSSNASREAAIAQIISTESNRGGIVAIWRPLSMLIFLGLILAAFFGYAPPNINDDLSPMMERIFNLFEIGLMGYIPARTIEKIVKDISIGKVLKVFVEKKLL